MPLSKREIFLNKRFYKIFCTFPPYCEYIYKQKGSLFLYLLHCKGMKSSGKLFYLQNILRYFDLGIWKTKQNCHTTSRKNFHQTFVLEKNRFKLFKDRGYSHRFERSVEGKAWALIKLSTCGRSTCTTKS